jgi:hypothetical protein
MNRFNARSCAGSPWCDCQSWQPRHQQDEGAADKRPPRLEQSMKANKRASFGLWPPTAMLVSCSVQANVRRFLAAVAPAEKAARYQNQADIPARRVVFQALYRIGTTMRCEFLERRALCHASASAAPW